LNSIKTNVSVKKLDIGCGKRKKEGFIGLDLLDFPGVDVHHDLNVFPYPFTDSEFDEIWADQVLEHLQDPLKAVEEIWRISKHSAIVHIGVPYFQGVLLPPRRKDAKLIWRNPIHQCGLVIDMKMPIGVRSLRTPVTWLRRQDIHHSEGIPFLNAL